MARNACYYENAIDERRVERQWRGYGTAIRRNITAIMIELRENRFSRAQSTGTAPRAAPSRPRRLHFNFTTRYCLTSALKPSTIVSIIAIDSERRYRAVQPVGWCFRANRPRITIAPFSPPPLPRSFFSRSRVVSRVLNARTRPFAPALACSARAKRNGRFRTQFAANVSLRVPSYRVTRATVETSLNI